VIQRSTHLEDGHVQVIHLLTAPQLIITRFRRLQTRRIVNFSVEPISPDCPRTARFFPATGTKTPPNASRSDRWVDACWCGRGNPRTSRTGLSAATGVEVHQSITPSPLSSCSAKWNLLAPYVLRSRAAVPTIPIGP